MRVEGISRVLLGRVTGRVAKLCSPHPGECASYRESEMMVFWWEEEARIHAFCLERHIRVRWVANTSLSTGPAWLAHNIPRMSACLFPAKETGQPCCRDGRSSLLIFASHHRPLRPPNSRTMQHVVCRECVSVYVSEARGNLYPSLAYDQ